MNSLIEAKLLVSKIKTLILDLTGALYADHLTDKDYCISQLLKIIKFIEENDISMEEIKSHGN